MTKLGIILKPSQLPEKHIDRQIQIIISIPIPEFHISSLKGVARIKKKNRKTYPTEKGGTKNILCEDQ